MRLSRISICSGLLGSVFALAAWAPAEGAATSSAHSPYKYTVLHEFAGAPDDGAGSGAEVTLDKSGNIYGTTDYGGANGEGTIFKIATDGTESVVHSFGGSGDGSSPDGAVTIESNGDMYGTTEFGGATGDGVIWELTADGTYSVLYNFIADQCQYALGRLIQDRQGNFYGTCLFGGVNGDGTVFRYSLRKGKVTVLHAFDGTDGQFPEHGVVMDGNGNLFGVTELGGATDNGTVYELASDGTFASLYSFTGGADGGYLYGGLAIDAAGNLYGSAVDGGAHGDGTVFKLAPGGMLTVLHSFTGGTDGGEPEGDMLLVGRNLYSTTGVGGAYGEGGIYELTAKGKLKVLADFSDAVYCAGLTPSGTTFYGTVQNGGTNDDGLVFSLTKK
ncbi:MAG TPA: choice-of-anchor tandem repeat GloVer-containing protein [Rhizomicrobium sp.]|nr:choice-of-anchor tandem repeat GloVer-containing protein [Rhizomicrobium sp.]